MKILVIGCGPAGMSFCHAIETKRQERTASSPEGEDDFSSVLLPKVTCMERASGPGGVWRSTRTTNDGDHQTITNTNINNQSGDKTHTMYEGLWTNSPKELVEFFDYTYEEHFGPAAALPVYMPRAALLEYMLARVTRKCPDFWERYAVFNTEIQSVVWNAEINKFQVISKNAITGKVLSDTYDKCIWGAGSNGKPVIPQAMVSMFRKGGFTGRIIHSTDTQNFVDDVKGKRVLLIGGSYSAEDLALTAIKVGAEKIYISTRQSDNVVSWTDAWPGNKVKLLVEMQPVKVIDNGKCILFAQVEEKHGGIFVAYDEIEIKVRNIDTVIFCTGFERNMGMLSEELRKPFEVKSKTLEVPNDWKMNEAALPKHLRDIEPGTCLWSKSHVFYPDLYKWTMIDNPNMMFLAGEEFEHPIRTADAIAWFFAKICIEQYSFPPPEEQRRLNKEQALKEMATYPMIRFEMDSNFYKHVMSTWEDQPEEQQDQLWDEYEKDVEIYDVCICAQIMRDGNYPLDIGTIDGLNDTGMQICQMDILCYEHRVMLDKKNKEEIEWRTFRDVNNASECRSLFTGTSAVPLTKRWIDIDNLEEFTIRKAK